MPILRKIPTGTADSISRTALLSGPTIGRLGKIRNSFEAQAPNMNDLASSCRNSIAKHPKRIVGTLSSKEVAMRSNLSRHALLVVGLLISATTTGCFQTTVGGQTLPSAYYLDDDVQYFPTGPETKLSNQIRALERYKAERESDQQGLNENLTN